MHLRSTAAAAAAFLEFRSEFFGVEEEEISRNLEKSIEIQ